MCLNIYWLIDWLFLFAVPGSQEDDTSGGRIRKLSLGQYDNDVPGQLPFTKCGWMKSTGIDPAVNPGSLIAVGETKEVNKEVLFQNGFNGMSGQHGILYSGAMLGYKELK